MRSISRASAWAIVALAFGAPSAVQALSINYLSDEAISTSGQTLVIHGMDLLLADSITIGGVNAPISNSQVDHIVCDAPPGVGFDLSLVVTRGSETASTTIDFLPPTVDSTSGSFPTQGGTSVFLFGSNCGPAGTSASASVGAASCTDVVVVDHDTISCTIPAGAGTDVGVQVSVAGQSSASANVFDYAASSVSFVSAPSWPTPGGTTVTIQGTNFGPFGATRSVTIGGNPCSGVSWTSHSLISCTLPAGMGTDRAVQVTVAGQAGPAADMVDYDAPVIVGVAPGSGPVAGSTPVVVFGSNLGTAGTLTFAGATVTATSWDHSSIQFDLPAIDDSHDESFGVSVGGQDSNTWPFTCNEASTPFALNIAAGAGVVSQFLLAPGLSVTITFANVATPGDLTVFRAVDAVWSDDLLGDVDQHSVVVDTVANTITVSGITHFSEWFIGNSSGLPVRLDAYDVE